MVALKWAGSQTPSAVADFFYRLFIQKHLLQCGVDGRKRAAPSALIFIPAAEQAIAGIAETTEGAVNTRVTADVTRINPQAFLTGCVFHNQQWCRAARIATRYEVGTSSVSPDNPMMVAVYAATA